MLLFFLAWVFLSFLSFLDVLIKDIPLFQINFILYLSILDLILKSDFNKSLFNIFSFRLLNLVLIYLDDLGKVKLSLITSKNQMI